MYRVVHTGANTALGGLKEGLFKVTYQVFTEEAVKSPDTAPTTTGRSTAIINRNV
jgi:hypothetical protein